MIWALLAGMFAVTYLPRLLPFLFSRQLELPHWIQKWLKYFPYAALGALIFPGILTAVPESPWLSASAGLLTAVCALFLKNITVLVILAIGFVLVVQNIGIL